MRPLRPLALLLLATLAGCGTGEQTYEESSPWEGQSDAPPPAPPQGQIEFVTRTDTVDALNTDTPATADTRQLSVPGHFTVQIGAFKDPQNAIQFQNRTRDRYPLPVSNEFNHALGLYQIRIGAFVSLEEAREQLLRMQVEFPAEYRDSWIVHVRR